MTYQDSQARPVRVVFRRSGMMVKIAVLAALVLSMAAMWTVTAMTQQVQEKTAALQAEAAALELENDRLERNIDDLGSVQGVINIAREELDLVDPDTLVFGAD